MAPSPASPPSFRLFSFPPSNFLPWRDFTLSMLSDLAPTFGPPCLAQQPDSLEYLASTLLITLVLLPSSSQHPHNRYHPFHLTRSFSWSASPPRCSPWLPTGVPALRLLPFPGVTFLRPTYLPQLSTTPARLTVYRSGTVLCPFDVLAIDFAPQRYSFPFPITPEGQLPPRIQPGLHIPLLTPAVFTVFQFLNAFCQMISI